MVNCFNKSELTDNGIFAFKIPISVCSTKFEQGHFGGEDQSNNKNNYYM